MELAKSRSKWLLGAAAVAIAGVLAFGLTGCGGLNDSAAGDAAEGTTLKVAAVPTPHAEILNDVVKPALAEEGVELEVVEFNDYVQPNTVTEEGEVDANYFQHGPYLENFNSEQGTHLVSIVPVHFEPFGLYAGKDKSLTKLEDLPEGAQVAVPNDATNEARGLLLLEQAGLITLKDGAGITATKADIKDNPKNLDIIEVEAANVPNTLEDVDLAAINSNYAIEAGLNVAKDAIATEDPNGEAAQTYANLLVVKEGNENNDAIKALAEALNSDAVRDYINNTYEGAVLPVF